MSDAKAFVRDLFDDVVNRRQVDKAEEYFATDFVDHGPSGDLHGIDAFKAMLTVWLGAFSDLRCEVDNVIQEGDLLAWTVHTTGTHTGDGLGFPATGRRIDTLSANIGRIRDGRAVEHWSEQGMLPMLVQLGVIPEMAPPPGAA